MNLVIQSMGQLRRQDPQPLIKGFDLGSSSTKEELGGVDLIGKVDMIGKLGRVGLDTKVILVARWTWPENWAERISSAK